MFSGWSREKWIQLPSSSLTCASLKGAARDERSMSQEVFVLSLTTRSSRELSDSEDYTPSSLARHESRFSSQLFLARRRKCHTCQSSIVCDFSFRLDFHSLPWLGEWNFSLSPSELGVNVLRYLLQIISHCDSFMRKVWQKLYKSQRQFMVRKIATMIDVARWTKPKISPALRHGKLWITGSLRQLQAPQ